MASGDCCNNKGCCAPPEGSEYLEASIKEMEEKMKNLSPEQMMELAASAEAETKAIGEVVQMMRGLSVDARIVANKIEGMKDGLLCSMAPKMWENNIRFLRSFAKILADGEDGELDGQTTISSEAIKDLCESAKDMGELIGTH